MWNLGFEFFDKELQQVAPDTELGKRLVRPQEYGYQLFGTEVSFRFPIVKLLDLKQQWSELEANPNPFATVVMAHLKALETRRNRRRRKEWKLTLTKSLYEKGYNREEIINLFRFIDWVMNLPQELEEEFWTEVTQFEEERQMPYITSVERRGIQQGQVSTLLRQLKRKFGELNLEIEAQIQNLSSPQLEDLSESLLDFASMDDLTFWLSNQR